MSGVSAEVDIRGYSQLVEALIKRGQDFTPAMQDIGEHMVGSVYQNFEEQGRPEKWKALDFDTLVRRYTRGNRDRKNKRKVEAPSQTGFSKGFMRLMGKHKILMDTGRLRGSITYRAGRYGVEIGTNVIYAAIHNFGGKAGRGHSATIPARPFLLFQNEDDTYVGNAILVYLMSVRQG